MSVLYCGFAQEKITPVLNGTFLDGYGFRMTPASGIRDDLFAKVCAIKSGNSRFLIVSLDLIGLPWEAYRIVMSQLTASSGLKKEDIALCAIHTHAAPSCALLAGVPMDADYLASVGDACGRAANRAFGRLCAGRFQTEITPETLLHSINRRGREPIDRRIRAASFIDENGTLRGVVCSAACHAVINTTMEISADFLSVLNEASSDETPLLYIQGRAADINPAGLGSVPIDELIRTLGGELAQPVLSASKRAVNSKTAGAPDLGEFVRIAEKLKFR